MFQHRYSYQIGLATLTVINVGDLLFSLGEELQLPATARAEYPTIFERRPFPSQCVHIALPGASLLVDASRSGGAADPAELPPNYAAPLSLLESLAAVDAEPTDIAHVVLTHPHWDHINGLTAEREGRLVPCFPHAQHLLGRADWDDPEMQTALGDPSSLESRTLGVVHAAGLLELVPGSRELMAGVRIIAAPGETPGHQVLRVESEGVVAYCLGDLVHSEAEVAHPEWAPPWGNRETLAVSRQALTEAALAEDALLVAAHIAGAGRLVRATGAGDVRWTAA